MSFWASAIVAARSAVAAPTTAITKRTPGACAKRLAHRATM
jgi:hypothetical protein